MTVHQLLNTISAPELAEWWAFYRLEPFGAKVNRKGHALTAMVVANANRKKGAKPFKESDFMHDFVEIRGPRRPQTWQEQLAIVEQLNKQMGGKDLRKK